MLVEVVLVVDQVLLVDMVVMLVEVRIKQV
jgi:hypothetical protein